VAKSNDSKVLGTGNAAALSRLMTLEASRAANYVSIRVRSIFSGVQRWVLAVVRTSDAVRRTAASFDRRNHSRDRRSVADRRWGNGFDRGHQGRLVMASSRRRQPVWSCTRPGSGSRRPADPGSAHRRPGEAAVLRSRRPGWSGRRWRRIVETPPHGAGRPPTPVDRGRRPATSITLSSEASRVLAIAAASTRNASASAPRSQNDRASRRRWRR